MQTQSQSKLVVLGLAVVVLAGCGTGPDVVPAQPRPQNVDWRHYAADRAATKYSAADQIDATNIGDLVEVWRWTTPDGRVETDASRGVMKGTPLVVGDVMYAVSALNMVSALDATTGEELWTHDPKAHLLHTPTHGGFTQRGIEYWTDGEAERVLLVTGTQQLVSIDAKTGRPDRNFGEGGIVDMRDDIATPEEIELTGQNSPAIVCADTVMMGMTVRDFAMMNKAPAGHIRGYDVRTGEKKWTFHTVPQEGEPGVETWHDESWRYSGNTNVWSWLSCDEETGWVYLPLGTPTSDYYGGHRHGDNLYAESLVALDAATGEKQWHFQAVRHGLWDYDFPCAPNLIDLEIDGRTVKAIAQVSKQGFTYVFDRRTGEPLWPIEDRAVAESTVPGEWTAATQPFPTKPPPFDRQGFTEDDLIDLTPELHAEALEMFATIEGGPLFTPPIVEGHEGRTAMVQLPSQGGGANWGGAAVDPETDILYVPSRTVVIGMSVVPPGPRQGSDRAYLPKLSRIAGPQGLPLVKPPWARLTAIDLRQGEILWQVPLGDGPQDHPALEGLDLPPLGNFPIASITPGWPMLTKTLVMVLQALPDDPAAGRGGAAHGVLLAYDKATGDLVAELELPGAPGGSPMTYMVDGRQFLVLGLGRRGEDHEYVAYALPGA